MSEKSDRLLNFTFGRLRLYLYRGAIIGCANDRHKPCDQTEIFTADSNQSFIVDEPIDDVVKKLKGE